MSLQRPLFSALGGAVANLWTAGAGLRAQLYEKGILRQQRLRAKVVSIGNITWGGTGKTPFTLWLASRLQAAGLRVSILTRGHGRTSAERVKILPPGTSPADGQGYGDEVQIYLRHLNVPIGIAARRYEAGRLLEQQHGVDVHLLDDGFQHLRLARDMDLVLIDSSNPWGARPGFSRLLREAPAALRRAHAILLNRCELTLAMEGGPRRLEQLQIILQKCNPGAPVFTVRTRLLHFISEPGNFPVSSAEMQTSRPTAFCGLGNSVNFFFLLQLEEIRLVATKAFPDHHRYRTENLRFLDQLAKDHCADCLITTEKDIVNLPEGASFSVPLYWAAIEVVVDQEAALLRWIAQKLGIPAERLTPTASITPRAGEQNVAVIS